MSPSGWSATAAYLYILRLDAPSLAWEYLRRNREYQDDWRALGDVPASHYARRWGLAYGTDPTGDASSVHVVWDRDPRAVVHLAVDPQPSGDDAARFSLWALPGRKQICVDRGRLLVTVMSGARVFRLALEQELEEGAAFAYLVRSGPSAPARWRAAFEHKARLHQREAAATYRVLPRPDRETVLHMCTLQALDGASAGASHRQIAVALFGTRAVCEGWHADSDLRARIRHLLKRGRALRSGDYRQLIR